MPAETEETVANKNESGDPDVPPASETIETVAQEKDPLTDFLRNAFPEVKGFSGVETSEPEETETPNEESSEENGDIKPDEKTEESSNEETIVNDDGFIIKTKVGETEKQWDLRNEEERTNLINRIQQLDHAETKFAEAKKLKIENELILNQQKQYFNANAMKFLFNAMQGKVILERPIYDDFAEAFDTPEQAREAFNKADADYLETQKQLLGFEQGYKTGSQSFSKMISEFGTKHPEIENPVDWITEKMKPYYTALESFGTVPFPEDTAEMIYWWTNKANFEEAIRQDERTKKAKAVPKSNSPSPKVNVKPKPKQLSPIDEMVTSAWGDIKGFKMK